MKLKVLKVEELDPTLIKLPRPLAELRADAAYPEAFAAIREQGFRQPALIGHGLAVVDGAHRIAAALDLDVARIPVVKLDAQQVDTWWNSLLEVKDGQTPRPSPLVDDLVKLGTLTGIGNGPGAAQRFVYEGPRALTLALYLTLVCDSGCQYCYWQEKPSDHPAIDVTATAAKLRELRLARPLRLQLWGGEPTLHPQFAELCRAASPWADDILVTSNGACGPALFEQALRTDNATISLSYHPARVELEDHLATFERLLERGYNVHATAVLWPAQLEAVRAWAAIMQERWPARYRALDCWLEAEGKFIGRDQLGELRGEPDRPARWRSPQGQLCRAGCDFAAVLFHEGGRIVRCLSGRQLLDDTWPQLRTFDKPEPCPSEQACPCRLMHGYWERG